ncbi:MAG: heavy-metal-associated domain-containing protein [Alphaproteobacteria bacterium]|nr:heavy-metal-associated domain-containing protein [Alphaproteobacteria bacterium]
MPSVLKVEGMTCEGCARSVKKAAERAAPGSTASVDLAKGEVAVAGAADLAAVAAAIRKAGYKVPAEA